MALLYYARIKKNFPISAIWRPVPTAQQQQPFFDSSLFRVPKSFKLWPKLMKKLTGRRITTILKATAAAAEEGEVEEDESNDR